MLLFIKLGICRAHCGIEHVSLSVAASWAEPVPSPRDRPFAHSMEVSAACTPSFAAQLIMAVPAGVQSLGLGEFLVYQAVQDPDSFWGLRGLSQLRTLRISCLSPVQDAVLSALRAITLGAGQSLRERRFQTCLTTVTSLEARSPTDTP